MPILMSTWRNYATGNAPSNPAMLANAGVNFALTLSELEKSEDFWPNLRKAVEHGLSKEQALAALTTTAAKIAGVDDKVGKLASGYMADFVMVKGDIFEDGEIQSVWLQGEENELVSRELVDFAGHYTIDWNGQNVSLTLKPGAVLSGELTIGESTQPFVMLSAPMIPCHLLLIWIFSQQVRGAFS